MTGCHYTGYLYVQQEAVDSSFLASAHVSTPDPRAEDPPIGQRLLIRWDFPKSIFDQNLTLFATIRFWDSHEELLQLPLLRKTDTTFFFFPKEATGSKSQGKILTYRITIQNGSGCEVACWEHPFWTPLITFDK
jgi:hypothetical protein